MKQQNQQNKYEINFINIKDKLSLVYPFFLIFLETATMSFKTTIGPAIHYIQVEKTTWDAVPVGVINNVKCFQEFYYDFQNKELRSIFQVSSPSPLERAGVRLKVVPQELKISK